MKKPLYIFLVFAVCWCGNISAVNDGKADSLSVTTAELADRMIEFAKGFLGRPYRTGGKGPSVFDCSGFTGYVYKQFGYSISATSASQAKDGRAVEGVISDLQKGDILIFGSRRNTRKIGHVGIYIGPDEAGDGFTFIHAAVHGGITVSNIKEAYYKARFLGVRRILPDFYNVAWADTASVPILSGENDIFVNICDTLNLKDGDNRIVLLSDGSWAFVEPDGMISLPSDTDNIILSPDGKWSRVAVQTHTIPSLSATPLAVSAPASAAATGDDATAVYHTIKSGDTLYGLALQYHTSVNSICQLNGITANTILNLGRKLRIK